MSALQCQTVVSLFLVRLDHDFAKALFDEINARLAEQALLTRAVPLLDATIIAAPSSTKNAKGERDPDMHQAKNGDQWRFGMKAHIGVDAESGLVHSFIGTAAHLNDVTRAGGCCTGKRHRSSATPAIPGLTSARRLRGQWGSLPCRQASTARWIWRRCGRCCWTQQSS